MSRLRVTVDPETCCAMGRCAATAPEVFDQDPETGKVVLLTTDAPPSMDDSIRLAAELCPCGAITVDDEEAPQDDEEAPEDEER